MLPELENNKNVVMRLAPFPSGPLHIGNARPYIINDEYVKRYKGKLFLVMDDTIGSKEKPVVKEAYGLIEKGLKWLKIKYDKVFYKSDRLEIYYKYAEEIIKKGYAYVCFCSSDVLRKNREEGISCGCRMRDISENLKEWKNMFNYKEGKAALRIKTDMKHPNPAFRDRVIFRISDREHPRVKRKYRVWPLLDFSWAIDDHLLGITHVIRGKELMMESDMENYIWDIFGWKKAIILHTGLLQLEGVKISKSKSREEVESGKYKGWDDPRTWSLQSLRRRGFNPDAIREFILEFGINENEVTVPVDVLYSKDKKYAEKGKRFFFVDNPKKIIIKGAPRLDVRIKMHPNLDLGMRKIKTGKEFYIQDELIKGQVYRLMHLLNFKDKKFISKEYDKNLNAKPIHWVNAKDCVKVEVLMDDGSIKKGVAEKTINVLKKDEICQFERNYFIKKEGEGRFIYLHK